MRSTLFDVDAGALLDNGLGRRETQSRIDHESGEVSQRHAEVEVARIVGDGGAAHLDQGVLALTTVDDVDDPRVLFRFELLPRDRMRDIA